MLLFHNLSRIISLLQSEYSYDKEIKWPLSLIKVVSYETNVTFPSSPYLHTLTVITVIKSIPFMVLRLFKSILRVCIMLGNFFITGFLLTIKHPKHFCIKYRCFLKKLSAGPLLTKLVFLSCILS